MSTASASTGAIEVQSKSLRDRFESITEGDYVRDILAVVLLAVSLALPTAYDVHGVGSKNPLFVGAVAIAALALVLPYAARFGLLPQSWTVARTRAVRLLLAVPFAALYLWEVTRAFLTSQPSALGVGAAFALAGAGVALAAQARTSELGPQDQDVKAPKTALLFAVVLSALIGVGYIATAVTHIKAGELVVLILTGGAIVFLPAFGAIFKRTRAWVTFLVGYSGAILAFLYLTSSNPDSLLPKFEAVTLWGMPALHPLSLNLGFGLFLVPALAAIVSSPAFTRLTRRTSDVEGRLDLAAIVLRVMLLVGAMFAIAFLAVYFFLSDERRLTYGIGLSQSIAAAVASLVVVLVAALALRSFNKNPGTSRAPITIALVAAAILAIAISALSPFNGLSFGHLVLLLVVPGIGAFALVGNKESRKYFAAASKERPEPRSEHYVWAPAPARPTPARSASTAQPATTGSQEATASPSSAGTGAQPQVAASESLASQPVAPIAPGRTSAVNRETNAGGSQVSSVSQVSAASQRSATSAVTGLNEQVSVSDDQPTEIVERVRVDEPAQASYAPEVQETQVIDAIPDESTVVVAKVAQARRTVAPEELNRPESAPTESIDQAEIRSAEDTATGSFSFHGYTEEQALDPATPAIVLAKIAEVAPELHPALAKNPSTYPALVDWLGQLGDPAVNRALAERNR